MKNFNQPGNAGRFGSIPTPQIQRSKFPLHVSHKTTFDSGFLVPCYAEEVLPGDTFSLRATVNARIQTLLNPIMDNVYIDTFFFFVPNRLVWDNWVKLNGEQENPGDSIDYTVPVIFGDGLTISSGETGDYFGLPLGFYGEYPSGDEPMALPFRAYNLIYNEWFRDQDLQTSRPVPKGDGPDDYIANYANLARRGRRHDIFTSARPWPQKGDSVELPLGSFAPVIGNGLTIGLDTAPGTVGLGGRFSAAGKGAFYFSNSLYGDPAGTQEAGGASTAGDVFSFGLTQDPDKSGLVADLSAATAATINQLRQAFAYQSILEMDARGGTRYTEIIRQHFRVVPQDSRLQRPEYLGGGSQAMMSNVVPQTSNSIEGSPQATLAGFGQFVAESGFNKSFPEHGWIIGILNVRTDITYQEQLPRKWTRRTRFDYYLPALAHLGEQALLRREVRFMSPPAVTNQQVFGYSERWAEYRTGYTIVSGLFRSEAVGTLDAWHLALDFTSAPSLNTQFIEDDPPIDRVIAVQDEDQILADMYFEVYATRPMPAYSIPSMLGGRF